ncbi:MAG TPA: ABC transporter permease [Bacteroidia bacterium]|jgi:ABC-type multidrug transport system permease subunit|nr:ABC transporter permease [Bacteroidia bacterium]
MLKITLKDIKLFITDRRAMFFTFFMPIMLISIFAMAFGGVKEINAKPMNLLIADLDQSRGSIALVNQIDSLKNIEVTRIPLDSGLRLVRTGEESEMLVFKKGFGDSLANATSLPIEMKYDPSKAAETGMMQQALMSSLMPMLGKDFMMKRELKKAERIAGPMDSVSKAFMEKQIAANYSGSNDEQSPVTIQMSSVEEEKQESPGLIQAVAGTAVMMLLFGMGAMSAGLLEEKENGTLKRLLYSPIRPSSILFGKMTASVLVALLQLSVLFLYASYAFHLDLGKNVPGLITMMVATSFACAGFGMLIASFSKTRQQSELLSRIIVLSMSAIGGSMIPTFLMPAFMQKISLLSINYWSIQGFYDIYWRGLLFTDPAFLMRPLILVSIGVGMMILSQAFFKKNVLKLA